VLPAIVERDDDAVELRQLEYFVAVAEERSFTRGARRALVVQSAVSAAVARLEREFEVTLFDRSTRQVALTEAGQVLLTRARCILGEAQRAHDQLHVLAGGVRGVVSVGAVLSTGSFDLTGALGAFREAHPGVTVHLRLSAGPLDAHAESLLDGRFNLLLLPVPGRTPAGVELHRIARMRMVLVCRTDDPLAEVEQVSYGDLTERSFVDFPEQWGNRSLIDAMFAADHAERTVCVEVVDISTALRMVRGRLGLAFLPSEALQGNPDLTSVDLRHPPPGVDLGLAVARERPMSQATRALWHVLLDWSDGNGLDAQARRRRAAVNVDDETVAATGQLAGSWKG